MSKGISLTLVGSCGNWITKHCVFVRGLTFVHVSVVLDSILPVIQDNECPEIFMIDDLKRQILLRS